MQPDELLIGVSFPIWSGRCGFAVEEFARRHGDFAIAGAAIGVELDADDRDPALRDRADRPRIDARAGRGRRSRGRRPARSPTSTPEELGRARDGRTSSRCPPTCNGSAAYRTRVGAAMVGARVGACRVRRRVDA